MILTMHLVMMRCTEYYCTVYDELCYICDDTDDAFSDDALYRELLYMMSYICYICDDSDDHLVTMRCTECYC